MFYCRVDTAQFVRLFKGDITECFWICLQLISFFPYNNFSVGLKCWSLSTLKPGLSDLTAGKNWWIKTQFAVILCLSVLLSTGGDLFMDYRAGASWWQLQERFPQTALA